jgi:hypothetical protein
MTTGALAWLRLVPVTIALVLSLNARAEVDFVGNTYETLADAAEFAAYFRKHGNVTLGPEQRLSNGVAWRVLTDVRTGARMPRVTWMPDRASLAIANRFLETAHGAAIIRVEEAERIRRGNEMIWKIKGGIPPRPLQANPQVVLSYASKRFIAFVDTDSRNVMVDMETSEIFAERRCWTRERFQLGYEAKPEYFDLGGLFDVCDDTAYALFHAAVLKWARRSNPQLRWIGSSSRSCHQIAWDAVGHDVPFLPSFITDQGLATYLGNDWVIPGPECRSRWPGGEPVIVPYSAVASFMRPGALRDELLTASPW